MIMVNSLLEAALLCTLSQDLGNLQTVEELGLRVAPGFKVTLFADQALANDTYAMTLDSRGRVVVTSQGWIKILEDTDGDGKADRETLFASTRTGGMGLCFDGKDLLFSGDNGLWRYRDSDGDGRADGPPELIAKFVSGEHGHHAMRKGPDGCWYLIGGNDSAIGKDHVSLPESPVKAPRTGAILRYTPDLRKSEVIAHGFRNPYDFDFNAQGEIFTYDSDCERDFFLPWYTPTRIFRVGYGMHHGWRLTGYMRSYANRDYYPDTVDILWAIGRGSPTGVVFYRHTAFPERYHDGFFALDWTFGKVYFLPKDAQRGEVFLEPTGTEGFAPTDIAVAPDGALFISIGGRRTRGAVYRIAPEKPGAAPARPGIRAILDADQPLDAWSRARWEPAARTLGPAAFVSAALDGTLPSALKVRAIEILVDLFDGVPQETALKAARDADGSVRARTAWAMGRRWKPGLADSLRDLASDEAGRVRLAALDAIADQAPRVDPRAARDACRINLGHPDKRVRQAAGRLYLLLSAGGEWVSDEELEKEPAAFLTAIVARNAGPDPKTVADVLKVLRHPKTEGLRQDAVRAVILGLGDTNLQNPRVEALSNYAVAAPPSAETRGQILSAFRPFFPSGDAVLDAELARLLAMLEDDSPETLAKVAAFLTEKSSPTDDAHYLIVLACLRAEWPEGMADRAAQSLLSLGKKLEWNEQRSKQTWGSRIAEVATLFAKHDPRFVDALVHHPLLVNPGHVGIAAAMEGPRRLEMARRFLESVKKDAGFGWSESLINLLSLLPEEEFHPVLRSQWSNFGLRDSILLHLARTPDPQDREKYLAGVESANAQASRAALEALERLPRDEDPGRLVPLLRLLRRLTLEPKQAPQRKQVVDLIARQSGKPFATQESGTEPVALKRTYQPVFDAFGSLKGELEEGGSVDVAALIKPVPWEQGDGKRGQDLFRARGCQTCHAVQGALGPNLVGAASRFSREDLFEAIANPSKDVAPPYRTTLFQMKDGNIYTGIVAFESADGFIVQTGATTTVRINSSDVAARRPGLLSLMPNGLLDGLKPTDLADLYAYLRSLGK